MGIFCLSADAESGQIVHAAGFLNWTSRYNSDTLCAENLSAMGTIALHSIIDSYTTEELKELGFSDEEIINYKKISLYDEILINPDLSKIEEWEILQKCYKNIKN